MECPKCEGAKVITVQIVCPRCKGTQMVGGEICCGGVDEREIECPICEGLGEVED